jgi:hypothetical protein
MKYSIPGSHSQDWRWSEDRHASRDSLGSSAGSVGFD